jgi:hypothetical protein
MKENRKYGKCWNDGMMVAKQMHDCQLSSISLCQRIRPCMFSDGTFGRTFIGKHYGVIDGPGRIATEEHG